MTKTNLSTFKKPYKFAKFRNDGVVATDKTIYKHVGDTVNNEPFKDKFTSFSEIEINMLLEKEDVRGIQLIKIRVNQYQNGNTVPIRKFNTYWMCGVDKDRRKLDGDEHFVIAPCPPFCEAGQ